MALYNGEGEELTSEQLLQAQAHIWKHAYGYVSSMSLRCAVQLGIPDAVHKHGKPITLPELLESINVDAVKSQHISRLMRLLVRSKFFTQDASQDEARYWLTPASCLLLKGAMLTLAPLVLLQVDPILTKPMQHMGEWFMSERHLTQFEEAHESTFWDSAAHEPRFGTLFDEAMSCDSRLIAHVLVRDYKHIFEGIELLVDVGGGSGKMSKAIADACPSIKCTVLDLPHVVFGLESNDRLSYVGGDMFEAIPQASAILLKWILHDWNDDECIKILKKCKDAITSNNVRGKVMIIDVVVDVDKEVGEVVEAQLYFDMAMMSYFDAKERSEKEWAKLFDDAGFTSYTITPAFGVRSLIEVYP